MSFARTDERRSHREERVRRIVRIVLALQRCRYVPSLDGLARDNRVSTRTIRRDLQGIEMEMPVRWRKNEEVDA